MGKKCIVVKLYEHNESNGLCDWIDHEMPCEFAKPAVVDMLKQMWDESPRWLLIGLTNRQLADLLEAVKVERLEREHGHAQAQLLEIYDEEQLHGVAAESRRGL